MVSSFEARRGLSRRRPHRRDVGDGPERFRSWMPPVTRSGAACQLAGKRVRMAGRSGTRSCLASHCACTKSSKTRWPSLHPINRLACANSFFCGSVAGGGLGSRARSLRRCARRAAEGDAGGHRRSSEKGSGCETFEPETENEPLSAIHSISGASMAHCWRATMDGLSQDAT